MASRNPLTLKFYFNIIFFCSILGELDITKLKSIQNLIKHDDLKPVKLFNNQFILFAWPLALVFIHPRLSFFSLVAPSFNTIECINHLLLRMRRKFAVFTTSIIILNICRVTHFYFHARPFVSLQLRHKYVFFIISLCLLHFIFIKSLLIPRASVFPCLREEGKNSSYGTKALSLCWCSSITLLFSYLPEKSQF